MPILYSFRRCPYAMRARTALIHSDRPFEHREIALRNKPAEMLAASPKGTVPVLILEHGKVLDESLDIMRWALGINDPDDWLCANDIDAQKQITALIEQNDGPFKHWLDRYKYASRFPEQSSTWYRQRGEEFLATLEQALSRHSHLVNDRTTLADMALAPFVRQFALVDTAWFDTAPYPRLRVWLGAYLGSGLFARVMRKVPLFAPVVG